MAIPNLPKSLRSYPKAETTSKIQTPETHLSLKSIKKHNKLVQVHKRTKWVELVKGLTHKGNTSKLWSTMKYLSTNSKLCAPNQAIYFDAERNLPIFDEKNVPRNVISSSAHTPYQLLESVATS